MDTHTIELDAYEQFKRRLRYNSLDHKVVLYFINRAFAYNYLERLVRPINSVLWYDIGRFSKISDYLERKCEEAICCFESTGYTDENCIGTYSDGYLVINGDDAYHLMAFEYDTSKAVVDRVLIAQDYNELTRYLEKIYDLSDEQFKNAIQDNRKYLYNDKEPSHE